MPPRARPPTPPPRLCVLMRPESETAVVIRQGPSRVFCTLGWNLADDELHVGQWCKHKLYPERCDISPDGRWLVYFALNGAWKSETRGSWTALSRAPYLKALKVWPQGDTWGGGGSIHAADRVPPPYEVGEAEPPLPRQFRLLPVGGRPQRLERDGWARNRDGSFDKVWSARWTLRKRLRGTFLERHQLIGRDQLVIDLPDWHWAEVDARRDRLVFVQAGAIYGTRSAKDPVAGARLIFDANPMTFEPLEAPYQDPTVFVTGRA